MSVSQRAPDADKGSRYLAQLDQALCNGRWTDIPELARKVDKHLPPRKCLTAAARAEAEIASASHRPSSASSTATGSIHNLSGLVPKLKDAIGQAAARYSDDSYIGKMCLAELYWIQEDAQNTLETLSQAVLATKPPGSASTALGWLEVCAVKADFFKATSLESAGLKHEARVFYLSVANRTPGYRSMELRAWTERLLARACMFFVNEPSSPSLQSSCERQVCFKAWADFWQRIPPSAPRGAASLSRIDISRRLVWKAYYDFSSMVLQNGLIHNPLPKNSLDAFILTSTGISEDQYTSARQLQRREFQRVEVAYESLLLEETKFPRANSSNKEVEAWSEQVIGNWKVFCGPLWTDWDLGEGGKSKVSRGVLDILYRAATRTFHSAPILRHLFTVHSALGEFELAMHAFDSYAELVENGKARAQKSAQLANSFDEFEPSILTAAEAVRILCRYGDRAQIEKATEVSHLIEEWLKHQHPETAKNFTTEDVHTNGESQIENLVEQPDTSGPLSSKAAAAAYRAIGISQATWSRIIFESETRSTLLADANNNLRRSQKFDPSSIETGHALAFVLAEMRDISGALEICRAILTAPGNTTSLDGDSTGPKDLEQQRRLVPLWHLLALCLSAKDEYDGAVKICDAAISQFGEASALFDIPTISNARDPEKGPAENPRMRGLANQVESVEKESLMQIKMSQIMLAGLLDGPEEAVDMTDQLLGLYTRLFGNPEEITASIPKAPPTAVSQAPSKFGTLRSIAGSIKAKSGRSSIDRDAARQLSVVSLTESTVSKQPNDTRSYFVSNDQTMDNPIAITVTHEDNAPSDEPIRQIPAVPSLPTITSGHESSPMVADPHASSGRPLQEIAHNTPHEKLPPPPGHEDQPPQQDVRLPAPLPGQGVTKAEPHLSLVQERRHQIGVLVAVWLFIAGLYIQAESFDDAQNAVNETTKLVELLEVDLSRADGGSTARKLFSSDWGCGKSVDHLWADVWSMKGRLASVREQPHEAIACYDQALLYYPDHPEGIIGISNLSMDIYEEKIPAEEPSRLLQPIPAPFGALIKEARPSLSRPSSSSTLPTRRQSQPLLEKPAPVDLDAQEPRPDPTPAELNRLAARDRAYMLLANLTKLGAGWDNSEAWLTLARAYELARQVGKAKQALWWVIELEDGRPMRNWRDVIPGGFTL